MIKIFKNLFKENKKDYDIKQVEKQFNKIEGIKSDYQASNIHKQCPCIK